MTTLAMNDPQAHAEPTSSALALRAALPGLAVAISIVLLGALVAALPDGSAPWVMLGAGIAALTGALGVLLKVRAVMRPGHDALAGNSLQIAILGDFVLQLFAVGGVTLALHLGGLKFVSVAGFAVAFAAVVLGHQAGSAVVLARALRRRSVRRGPAPHASSSSASTQPTSNPR